MGYTSFIRLYAEMFVQVHLSPSTKTLLEAQTNHLINLLKRIRRVFTCI